MASLPGRLRRLPALAAALAQLAQAAGSFALQVVAAHALGASGLGTISLCLGTTILTTAVTSGLVGDSLTVLDRHDRRVRAALQAWLVVVTLAGSVGAALVLDLTGVLTGGEAVLFAVATAAFQVEEVLRRVLMAVQRFWTLLVVDGVAVATTLLSLLLVEEIGVGSFLLSVAVGQAAGIVVALAVLPRAERRLVPLRGAALREVIAFGGWRGAQVALTPTGLTISRFVLLGATGAVALGEVEAGRILGAPALLVVQGLGSYLLSTYARDHALPLDVLRARARRASLAMAGTAVALGVVVTALTPFLAPLAVGRAIDVHLVTVAGWALFAAATATMQPFASLAVTRGSQRAVFGLRALDVVVGTGLLALALGPIGLAAPLTPLVLAVGPVLSGVLVRTVVLRTPGADRSEGQS
ncbi:hypothetical protein [Oryzobacter terrae]|uniref:hypothetical protein n=1 Tax=Oryzobacter terrae TaxID=1620385 RepID=UPI00366B0EA3